MYMYNHQQALIPSFIPLVVTSWREEPNYATGYLSGDFFFSTTSQQTVDRTYISPTAAAR